MSKRVLVTGGAGFIGSFLVDELVTQKNHVRVLDNLEPQVHISGKIPNYLNKNIEFVKGDVRDIETLKKNIKDVDVVFHFAAMVGVGQSMYDIARYVDVNTLGTAKLMDAVVNSSNDVKKVVIASSMSIYGEGEWHCENCNSNIEASRTSEQLKNKEWDISCPKCYKKLTPVPVKESKRPETSSIYAITKKDQEDIVMNIGRAYKVPTVALRYFNTYGPRQSLNNPYTGVAAIFMSRVKNNKAPMIFEDGNQIRDFVSIHDITQANVLAMNSSSANGEIFNVGSGEKITIKELALKIIKLYGAKLTPEVTNNVREGDIRHCFSDISKIKKKLNFSPKVKIEDGLMELIKWSEGEQAIDNVSKAASILKEKKMMY
jgi:dTDP-L-rhamnose 4-epimerase